MQTIINYNNSLKMNRDEYMYHTT